MAERRTSRTGLSRLRPLLPLATIWAFGCLVLTTLALQRQVPYDQLLLDPNRVAGVPWYTGLVSNLGILSWTIATGAGYAGAWIARYGERPAAAGMLINGAVLSTLLLFDDLLQLHVMVKPLLGVPKVAVYLVYLLVASRWIVVHRAELRRTQLILLIAAAGAFAVSVGVDQIALLTPGLGSSQRLLVEDATKFLGVLAWAQYFVLTSGSIVTSIVTELRQKAERAGVGANTRSDEPSDRSAVATPTPTPSPAGA